MSRPPVSAMLALALLPALAGCSQTHTADVGTPVSVSHPVGAYEHEFRRGNNADVDYEVHNLSLAAPDQADFDLTITVPEFGRPFGFRELDVTCVTGAETSTADTNEERRGEEFGGVFEFPMWCAVPEGADHLAIEIDHHGEHLRFEGSLD